MKKSMIQFVQEVESKLLEYPNLVNLLEKKDPLFSSQILNWIKSTEDLLQTHQIRQVSEISALRSKLILIDQSEERGASKRKALHRMAGEILFDLQKTLNQCIEPLEIKINSCKDLIRQILSIISQGNIIRFLPTSDFEMFLSEVWTSILSSEQLMPGVIKLKTDLSSTDIKLLLASEIDLNDFS
jgi:hypothetical protein